MKKTKYSKSAYLPKQNVQNIEFDPGSGYALNSLNYSELIANDSGFNFNAAALAALIQPNIMHNPLPYKEPRLIVPQKNAKDKRWYIIYYVWDQQQQKIVRKRDYKINEIQDFDKRKLQAKTKIKQLKLLLKKGYHVDRVKIAEKSMPNKVLTIQQAFDLSLKSREKLRSKTQKNYNDYLKKFANWLYQRVKPNLTIDVINETVAKKYINWLQDQVGPRTVNNNIVHVSTLFNYLVKESHIKTNPFAKVERPKNPTGKNIAYNKTQVNQLLKHMEKRAPNLLLFCQTMYYTLARPNELVQLQIKHIDMYRPQHLYIPANAAKNNADRHVVLPSAIYSKLKELKKLNPDWYLFGRGIEPNAEPMPAKNVSDSYRRRVLVPLGYKSDYTLYSWKHTGVVTNYLAGITPAALRLQIGHLDTGSFEKYLKSLGLFENKEVMDNYVALPV